MVFKSDKQRKKVMALLRGGTKSAVKPQIISGKIKFTELSDEKREKLSETIERQIGVPLFVLEDNEIKRLLKLSKTHKLDSTMFGGEGFDKRDALRFAKNTMRLKMQGFKKIGITVEGPDDSEIEVFAKRKK